MAQHSRSDSKLSTVIPVLVVAGIFAVGVVIGTQGSALIAGLRGDSERAAVVQAASGPQGFARVDPPYQLSDFTLTADSGSPLQLSDLPGEMTLLFFGYTNCPDVCPTTLQDFTTVKRRLGSAAADVNFVFVSVDGSRDTPETVAEYLSRYDAEFIGMTGSEDLLREIGREYGLQFAREAISVGHEHEDEDDHDLTTGDENYFVQHTSPSFLIDRDGRLRALFFYGSEPELIANGIREFMAG